MDVQTPIVRIVPGDPTTDETGISRTVGRVPRFAVGCVPIHLFSFPLSYGTASYHIVLSPMGGWIYTPARPAQWLCYPCHVLIVGILHSVVVEDQGAPSEGSPTRITC